MLLSATFLLLAAGAHAHIALWHTAMFGLNYPDLPNATAQNWNTNGVVAPLRAYQNLTIDEWFAHGFKNLTPPAGEFMEIPSGGRATFELACNRAYTSYRNPGLTEPLHTYACKDGTGPLHNANKLGQKPLNMSLFGGTAISISYTSDVAALQPSDMTVISVNYTSPWYRLTDYEFPERMPECPDAGCLCQWSWVHTKMDKEGYPDEIYSVLYRCKVTGKTNKHNTVPKGEVTRNCEGNESKCIAGPKQPMYLWQKTGNNMDPPPPGQQNPTYNMRYGWKDGAQLDAVVSAATSAVPSAVPSAATSSATSAATRGVPRTVAMLAMTLGVAAILL